jgi:cephalosporin hydroxylase
VGRYLHGTFPGEVVVEIGSDRWEGSSAYFADLANTHGMRFISVDIDQQAGIRVLRTIASDHAVITEIVQDDGTKWSARYQGPRIRVLYLDNFDWDWRTDQQQIRIQNQVQWYANQGIVMNNLNCQVAHLSQMMNLMPHMSDQCVICVDDTYEHNGVYLGKGGAVIPYLLSQGFSMLEATDHGTILGRDSKNIVV